MAGGAARAIEVTPSSAAGRGGRGVDLRRPTTTSPRSTLRSSSTACCSSASSRSPTTSTSTSRAGSGAGGSLGTLVGADGASLSYIVDSPESPPDADGWHTDITWIEEPPKMAFLQAVEIPARGGDTMWASLGAAYGALSPVMQQVCRQLQVEHVVHDRIIGAFERAR